MSGSQRQSRFERGEDVVVMKFGGTSVEDEAAIRRLIGIVESRLGAKPVLIISALAKVTDQLLEAGNAAAKGHLGSALATVRNIYVRHEELADFLLSASAYGSLDRELRGEFQALESFLQDLETLRVARVGGRDDLQAGRPREPALERLRVLRGQLVARAVGREGTAGLNLHHCSNCHRRNGRTRG